MNILQQLELKRVETLAASLAYTGCMTGFYGEKTKDDAKKHIEDMIKTYTDNFQSCMEQGDNLSVYERERQEIQHRAMMRVFSEVLNMFENETETE